MAFAVAPAREPRRRDRRRRRRRRAARSCRCRSRASSRTRRSPRSSQRAERSSRPRASSAATVESPFQTLAFLALSVIPSLKITDRGLVDVDRFELVPLRGREHPLRTTPRSSRWTTPAPSTTAAGCSSRTGSSPRSAASTPPDAAERVDLGGAVVTPGLVNTHHHLYQTLTRARAQEADLFTWLRDALSRSGRGIDEESEYAAARTGLAELALSGCTTVFDHHYVFPRGTSGLIEAEVRAARELGVRIVASRGSMDLGESDGGLPPDSLVEELDDVLADTERLAALADGRPRRDRGRAVLAVLGHERADGGVGRARAPARARLHTHLAETVEEEEYCRELFGCTSGRVPRASSAGSRRTCGARTASTSPPTDVATFARARRRRRALPDVEHAARRRHRSVRELLDAGVRVGLGVDGSASNERGDLFLEVKQALLVARGARRAGGDDRARGAAPRHARRRGGARAGRHRLARAGQARRLRRLAHGRPRARRRRRPGRRPRLRRARIASTGSTSAARRSCATASSLTPTRTRSRASIASRRRRFAA